MKPKIFIGTMYSGEAEFQECCTRIHNQKDVSIYHSIISDKKEFEAHNELWKNWNEQKKNFDLFIKIDADTLLVDDMILKRVADTILSNSRITGMQIPLLDFFTEQEILGLNCFTPKVTFNLSSSRLYPDRVDTNHDIVLRNEQVRHLSPAGYHCLYPHNKQAFHFAAHRMLKKQYHVMKDLCRAWLKHRDNARLYAMMGALASVNFSNDGNSSYDDVEFVELFQKFDLIDQEQKIKMAEIFCGQMLGE